MLDLVGQFMNSSLDSTKEKEEKENYSINVSLFNKTNGPNKKELYKKIILEAMKIIKMKETDVKKFRTKLMQGDDNFKTVTNLALVMEAMITCIGKYSSYTSGKPWCINSAFKKLKMTFKNLDNLAEIQSGGDLNTGNS